MGRRKSRPEKKESKIILRFEQKSPDLNSLVDHIISENTKDFLEFRAGMPGAIDKMVNSAMKKTGGKVDPQKVRKLIISKL